MTDTAVESYVWARTQHGMWHRIAVDRDGMTDGHIPCGHWMRVWDVETDAPEQRRCAICLERMPWEGRDSE